MLEGTEANAFLRELDHLKKNMLTVIIFDQLCLDNLAVPTTLEEWRNVPLGSSALIPQPLRLAWTELQEKVHFLHEREQALEAKKEAAAKKAAKLQKEKEGTFISG